MRRPLLFLFPRPAPLGAPRAAQAVLYSSPVPPHGGLPEWPMGADCKSVGLSYEGSNPSPATPGTAAPPPPPPPAAPPPARAPPPRGGRGAPRGGGAPRLGDPPFGGGAGAGAPAAPARPSRSPPRKSQPK